MNKKTYITPVISTHCIKLRSSILALSLSADDNTAGTNLLRNGGTTSSDSFNGVVDARSDNAWDIWGSEDE